MSSQPRQLIEAITRWREHPATMVRELFKTEPDPWQERVLEEFPHYQRVAMQACKGPGKGSPKSLEIDTPSGTVRWGTLKAGDLVFAEDGSPCAIAGTYELGRRKIYRVVFDDGSSTRVTADHLWKVQGRTERRKQLGWAVLTTEQILERGVTIPNGNWKQKQFIIPRQGAAHYRRATLDLDPYLAGVWLGDGTRNAARYDKPCPEIEAELNRRGYVTVRGGDGVRVDVYTTAFREFAAFHHGSPGRFVPENYKRGSVEQRTDLLCGLMDTDGTIGKDGHIEFASTSKRLADDVIWLVRSLGGIALMKATIKEGWYYDGDGERVDCRDCYRVTVVLPFNPFRVGHKAGRWGDPLRSPSTERYLTRFIAVIEPDGEEDAMCIAVDHPSRCYLTNDFIVTHNTTVEAWLAWNFLLTRMQPKVAATSISGDNLRDNLWAEMAKWRQQAPLLQTLFEWTTTRIFARQFPETWWMSARTWPKTGDAQAQANTLAGLHADYILFILDESGAIPDSVMASAEAALASCKEGHIVQAGNPTNLEGPLYRASRDRIEDGGLWRVTEITGDPNDPLRSPRVSVQWAEQQIKIYGRDNPWVLVNVFGKFPPSSINALISEDEVLAAMKRGYREYEYRNFPRILGIDVARQGDDASVIVKRQGPQMFNFIKRRNVPDGMAGASLTNRVWGEFEADACFIDATGGFGFTWIDQLKVLGRTAIGVGFANEATQSERFYNKRAEMAFGLVDWIRQGGALPPRGSEGADELLAALTRTTYSFKGDRVLLEDKGLVKIKLGYSPDEFDGAILTFAEPVSLQRQRTGRVNHSAMNRPYDAFAEVNALGAPILGPTSNYDPFSGS